MKATIENDGAITTKEADAQGRVNLGIDFACKEVKIAYEVIEE